MVLRSDPELTRGGASSLRCIACLGLACVILQGSLLGQTFKSTNYQANSQTAGIQEAIDAAAKAGGGTVQIPAGTFLLHAAPDRPAIVLRSRVNITGAGADRTILKLEANSKTSPAVMANQSFANPDAGEADHDITLQGFTIDAATSDQVRHETKLSGAIPVGGESELAFESREGVAPDSLVRVDPGPNEEIVPILSGPAGKLKLFLMHPHPAGAKVVLLRDRLHGIALVGARDVTMRNITLQNIPMDGIYLTSSVTPGVAYHSYCQRVNIENSSFIGCHRNGVSVIDAEDVLVANNNFRGITGDPGAPVDIEPNHPEQHGVRITIRDNEAFGCYRGITLALRLGAPKFENFRDEVITGNKMSGMLYGWGLYAGQQQAGARISGNTIAGPAGDGIVLIGSAGIQVTDNEIIDPGRCHTPNCRKTAGGVGIRIADDTTLLSNGNTVTNNKIVDDQSSKSMLYGIDFCSKGRGNSIQRNMVSRFEPKKGMVIHVCGKAESNTISENVQR